MRLLGCFSKRPVVVNLPSERPSSQASNAPAITAPPTPTPQTKKSSRNKQPPTAPPTPPPSPPKQQLSSAFVPTSIPELHPEYAHSEPYCFVARTESARVVVDRLRGARGQPSLDHAHILREQGVTVVRGPSYSATKFFANLEEEQEVEVEVEVELEQELELKEYEHTTKKEKSLSSASVPLRIEQATGLSRDIQDSDDENENIDNENINDSNVQKSKSPKLSRKSKSKSNIFSPTQPATLPNSANNNSINNNDHGSVASPNKSSFRIKSRKSRQKLGKANNSNNNISTAPLVETPTKDNGQEEQERSLVVESEVPRTPVAGDLSTPFERLMEKHMDNTPTELLAPIMVPRTSIMYGESPPHDNNQQEQPTLSASSSLRYADADDQQHQILAGIVAEQSQSSPLQGLRARRKSKPFLTPVSVPSSQQLSSKKISPMPKLSEVPVPSNPDSIGTPLADRTELTTNTGLSRRESSLLSSASSSKLQQPRHIKPLDIPRAAAMKPILARRASSTNGNRKTVSFHDAAPVIIEPNLKAPSHSLPRLGKDSTIMNGGPPSIGSVLSQVRDSVTGFVPLIDVDESDDEEENEEQIGDDDVGIIPRHNAHTLETQRNHNFNDLLNEIDEDDDEDEDDDSFGTADDNEGICSSSQFTDSDTVSLAQPITIYSQQQQPQRPLPVQNPPTSSFPLRSRQRSDVSYGSSLDTFDTNQQTSWNNNPNRNSRRVSVHDKTAIREATRRQSMAVAQVMSQQIKGVPRSAMLAYSQNEIVVDDEETQDDHNNRGSSTGGMESSGDDGNGSFIVVGGHRRKSRKSIIIPEVKPGEVPLPPPPPPFSPTRLNIRSVRLAPPPPPSSPLQH